MHSLEPELRELGWSAPVRPAFSVFAELRVLIYGAVLLVSTGVALLVKDNLQRIGPLALTGGLLLAAVLCYAAPVRAAMRRQPRNLIGDYLLLLGGLLLSAALGYAESQYRWFGDFWSRHLLLLAVIHGCSAYLLDSRLLLALSLSTLAAWVGLDPRIGELLDAARPPTRFAAQAASVAALVQLWRELHRWLNARQDFAATFNHFSLNLAFWAALTWCSRDDSRWWGVLVLAALTAAALIAAFRQRSQFFAVYGIGYSAAGISMVIAGELRDELATALSLLLVVVTAVAVLWHLRDRLRNDA